MIIQDLARKCKCDPATIRKWIKKNNIETHLTKCNNRKMVQAISEKSCEKFYDYWIEINTFPSNMISIPNVAKKNNVDRKTVKLWIEKNNIKTYSQKLSTGPMTQIIELNDCERFTEEYNSKDCVPISNILNEFNTDLMVVKRWVKKNNCKFMKVKSDKGGRTKLSLKRKDAIKLEQYLMQMKSEGFFYMIQPVPEFNPNRIKLGFSKKFNRRLKEHRTICPNAKLIKKWKCNKNLELEIILKATNDCNRIYTKNGPKSKDHATEVFDCADYKVILSRLESLFK